MEIRIKIPNGTRVTQISETPEGDILIEYEKDVVEEWGFQPIGLEGYSMESPGMGFEPEDEQGNFIKCGIRNVFKTGIRPFWATKKILHMQQEGSYTFEDSGCWGWESFNYLSKLAKEVKPNDNTRLGTDEEFFAFLAVEIIQNCKAGMEPKMAWENAVKSAGRCNLLINKETGDGILTGSIDWMPIAGEEKDTSIWACVPWIVCR